MVVTSAHMTSTCTNGPHATEAVHSMGDSLTADVQCADTLTLDSGRGKMPGCGGISWIDCHDVLRLGDSFFFGDLLLEAIQEPLCAMCGRPVWCQTTHERDLRNMVVSTTHYSGGETYTGERVPICAHCTTMAKDHHPLMWVWLDEHSGS
jgi:hypothetical protein